MTVVIKEVTTDTYVKRFSDLAIVNTGIETEIRVLRKDLEVGHLSLGPLSRHLLTFFR